ncbi:response regulator with CheY-like receiver, AAA-type ATPase, and DNA-binding domains [Oscillatoria acuminata PCC 6304]|uniref:Response regulator with CheY-like receiver, AAA-type ATPase, and DNA-binding domains n=2 Tax=Oscillatoria acuminata TaxID=118323 RepID=K9TJT4_9CYAN|nr:response regulator with CheY-like receiver, AAA-type ATPase, and DNA-binding domains [Oscillatoria acuminata PCC 6304]
MAKILIVDDSTLSRGILRRILQTEGHSIIEAKDGLMGIESYYIEKPDLVLLDIAMPDMQGTEVLEKLRAFDDRARIVMATADLQELTRAAVMAAGALGYLTKPYNPDVVLDIVNQVLRGIPGGVG